MRPQSADRQFFDLATLRRLAERLRDSEASFAFCMTDGFSDRVFQFAEGGVRVYSSGERTFPDLEGYLTSRKILDARAIEEYRHTASQTSRPLGAILLERGALTSDGLQAAIRKVTKDAIYDLVFWSEACCSFCEPHPPQRILERLSTEPAVRFDFPQLAEDIVRWGERWNELQSTLHSDTTRIVLTDLGATTLKEYNGHLRDTLELCKEPGELRTAWSRVDEDLLLLCEQLRELIKLEWVRVLPATPGSRSSKKELAQSITILERNLDTSIDAPFVREKLVRLYHKSKLPEKAAAQLHELAELDLGRGEWQTGIERLKKILEFDPVNLDAYRRIVKTYLQQDMAREAVGLIASHARVLLSRKRDNEARRVADTMRRLEGGRVEADLIEAEILAAENKRPDSVRLLSRIAESCAQQGDSKRAVEVMKKALALDPENARIRDRVIEMSSTSVHAQKIGASHTFANRSSAPVSPTSAPATITTTRRVAKVRLPRRISGAAVFFMGVFGVLGVLSFVYWNALGSVTPRGGLGGLKPKETLAMESAAAGQRSYYFEKTSPGSSTSPSTFSTKSSAATRPTSGLERNAGVSPSIKTRERRPNDGMTRRVVKEKVLATFASSEPLVMTNRWTKQQLYTLPARTDEQWSIGYRGVVICQWKAGERARIFRPPSTTPTVLGWEIPVDTVAVAVGVSELALRRGTHTIFYRYDGKPTGGGEAPLWTEGVYMGTSLLLQRPALTVGDQPEVWCVRHGDLRVLWTCTVEDGAAVFR